MILNRYVQKTMLLFMASIVLVFLALQAILSFSSEFNSIGTGSYTLWHALAYVMLTSLSALYKIFPFIALLASLLSIHYLHKHHEITVMRASGMSMPMLCYAICTVGIVLTIASTLIGEAIAPRFERFAFTIKTKATSSNQFVATKQGLWLHDNHDFIYINKIQSEHALSGISRYTVDTKHNSFVKSSAKSAELINHQWVFKDIIENRFTTDGWKQHNFSEQTWTLPLTKNLMQSMMLNPEQ
jgi:lipopolysaccharide export system permease protein